jgi:hypothetical protein
VFTKGIYSLDVSEATTRGTKIGDILAIDEDEGVNGVVTYSMISDWANDVFNIDPHTGAFSLTGKLDYEEASAIVVFVCIDTRIKRLSANPGVITQKYCYYVCDSGAALHHDRSGPGCGKANVVLDGDGVYKRYRRKRQRTRV